MMTAAEGPALLGGELHRPRIHHDARHPSTKGKLEGHAPCPTSHVEHARACAKPLKAVRINEPPDEMLMA